MKITMYELLGLVKDGKAPKKIKTGNIIYELDDKKMIWADEIYHEVNKDYIWLNFKHIKSLNDEVEILEEKKIPERLEEPRFNKGRYYIRDINGDDSEISGIERTFRLKINEIIDYLDYLKSKD